MTLTPFNNYDEIVVGMRVICQYPLVRYEELGTIISKESGMFVIKWDDGMRGNWSSWQYFCPIDQDYLSQKAEQKRREDHAEKYL